jgi:hypothetical protein
LFKNSRKVLRMPDVERPKLVEKSNSYAEKWSELGQSYGENAKRRQQL